MPAMRQLSGIDVSFLNMETPTAFGHVSSLNIYDPSTARRAAPGSRSTKQIILERIDQLAPFRRRLVEVPLGLDLPYWIEDPDFDIDFHVRHHAVAAAGHARAAGRGGLPHRRPGRSTAAGRCGSSTSSRASRAGGIAQLTKIHHATIDGASGALMLAVAARHRPRRPPDRRRRRPGTPEPMPTDAELLADHHGRVPAPPGEDAPHEPARCPRAGRRRPAAAACGRWPTWSPSRCPGRLGDLLRAAAAQRLRHRGRRPAGAPADAGAAHAVQPADHGAPPLRLHHDPARRRQGHPPRVRLHVQRRRHGAVLGHPAALPPQARRAARRAADRDGAGQHPQAATRATPTRTGSRRCWPAWPPTRPTRSSACALVQQSMTAAKGSFAAIPAETLQDFTQFAPPAIAARAMRMYSRLRIADRMNPPFNLDHLERARPGAPALLGRRPASSTSTRSRRIVDGQGLNMTVQSYNGNLDFGFIACRELVPDLWSLTDYLHESMQELLDSIGPAEARSAHEEDHRQAWRRRRRPASGHRSSGRRLGRQALEVGGVVVADELPAARPHPPQLGERRVDGPQLEHPRHRQVEERAERRRRSRRRGTRRPRSAPSWSAREVGGGRGRRGGGTRPASRRRGSATACGSPSQSGMPWRSMKASKVRPSHSGPGSCSPTLGVDDRPAGRRGRAR